MGVTQLIILALAFDLCVRKYYGGGMFRAYSLPIIRNSVLYILECYAVYGGNSLPTFRDYLSIIFKGTEIPRSPNDVIWDNDPEGRVPVPVTLQLEVELNSGLPCGD